MFADTVFVCLYVVISNGVFGVDSDEVKSLMEGESVTLHNDLTDIQTDDHILWMFVPRGDLIAEIIKHANFYALYDDADGRFRDKLKLNNETGSLTITNISITNSGLYKLQICNRPKTKCSEKRFNVTVYARLPVPVIISYCPQNPKSSERFSVSKCVLLCSVMNVTHVSLSWFKGNSLLSSISVSDLNIRLSLPLEVEYRDTNTYGCVINNPITNHTQHLHINDVCQPCLDPNLLITPAVIVVTVFLLWLIAVVIYRHKKAQMDRLQSHLDLISRNMQEKCGSKLDRNTEEFPTRCRPTVLV